jgi:hypothetical protein
MDGAGLFVSETQAEEKSMIIGCWDIKQPDASIKGRYHSYQIPVVTKNEVGQKDSSGWVPICLGLWRSMAIFHL